ncbi:type I toxin-antitoxin system Fst family toxin [Enterococcus faecalis]|nr:type I toxin-antitoxin system Fst family toxin [Enterococcus faecalis]
MIAPLIVGVFIALFKHWIEKRNK